MVFLLPAKGSGFENTNRDGASCEVFGMMYRSQAQF